jgi:uncharacterized protein (TIGR03083 family)
LSSDALAALEGEISGVFATLASISDEDWERPTRCPPMTVRVMTGHLLRQAHQLLEYPQVAGSGGKDAVAYYRYDPPNVASAVVQRATQMAGDRRGPEVRDEFNKLWPEALSTSRSHWADNPIVETILGQIALQEYTRTRCVEATVHHMDILDALGRSPAPHPEALAVTVGVLEGLLSSPLGETGMQPIDFVLLATGRRPLSESERDTLGPLADKFPVLQ